MASKENQRCIDQIKSIISHPIPDMAMAREFIIDYLNKLQQAIDRQETIEKELLKLEVDYNNLLSSNSLEIESLEKEIETYKKALKLIIKDTSDLKVKKDDCFVKFVCSNTNCNECIENNYLIKARNEIENDRK